jgi:tryptophan synthase alpha chain
MNRVDTLFQELRRRGQKAFIPFVTAGDPNLDFTVDVLSALADCGSHLCEVGIPYSDPIADGPVIQASYTRALRQGIRVQDILGKLGEVTPRLSTPVVTMVSYAIVYRHGLARYIEEARQAGVAGAIVPDLLVDEAEEFARLCRQQDFSLIQLATPTTPRDRALRIAELSTGFLYYVSVTGITGERRQLPAELVDNVGWLRDQTSLPICIGFGISTPDNVRLVRPVADGVIVGSAIVRRLSESSSPDPIGDVRDYVTQLIQALNA